MSENQNGCATPKCEERNATYLRDSNGVNRQHANYPDYDLKGNSLEDRAVILW